ncbi:hypothetical protein R1sor_004602 [Riccia sorocarpa]|uniref:Uncharacterized protein n=1 Tax=Riccia sorocarpa TaxID=122646 RepID=A0ABD3HJC8_9MARC
MPLSVCSVSTAFSRITVSGSLTVPSDSARCEAVYASSQLQQKQIPPIATLAFRSSHNRSSAAPSVQINRGRSFTMTISAATSNAVEMNGLSVATKTESIPVFTLEEVASKLQQFTEPKRKPYTAMYSSIVGGITLDPAAMVVPLDDHIVHRGHAVFDTATVFNGYLYELDAHVDRLLRSAAQARIPLPFSRSVLRNILVQTAAASGSREGTLRYWLSTGPGGFDLSPSECEKSSFYAVMIAVRAESPGAVSVITSSVPIKKQKFATMKTTNYLPNALSKMDAEDKGAFQAVWLDDEGYVAEAANMNVAFVSKGTLLMPAFDNILSGCTAKRVVALAEQLAAKSKGEVLQKVEVRKISVEEAKSADEMMLLVSSYRVVPVTEWDGQQIGDGVVGPVTRLISDVMYQDLINGPPEVREPVPYQQ